MISVTGVFFSSCGSAEEHLSSLEVSNISIRYIFDKDIAPCMNIPMLNVTLILQQQLNLQIQMHN